MADISAGDVKSLRDKTGAGMMDCKRALQEAAGDLDKAVEILRVKGQAQAAKRGERTASEGTVQSYIHATGKIGVLVEVDCETDFVAKNSDFQEFARDVALHIAAAGPSYVSEDEVPDELRKSEQRIYEEQAQDKPEQARPKIVEGRWRKWLEENVLLNQVHVNSDKHNGQTIEDLRAATASKTGENIVIRRFARFQVGEEQG
jgi:elongation factor Ts